MTRVHHFSGQLLVAWFALMTSLSALAAEPARTDSATVQNKKAQSAKTVRKPTQSATRKDRQAKAMKKPTAKASASAAPAATNPYLVNIPPSPPMPAVALPVVQAESKPEASAVPRAQAPAAVATPRAQAPSAPVMAAPAGNPYLANRVDYGALPGSQAVATSAWGLNMPSLAGLSSLLPRLPGADEAILPRIKTVYPTGEKPLVVITFKCPTEVVGITTPPIKLLREGITLLLDGINRTNLLSFNMQQVCQ